MGIGLALVTYLYEIMIGAIHCTGNCRGLVWFVFKVVLYLPGSILTFSKLPLLVYVLVLHSNYA